MFLFSVSLIHLLPQNVRSFRPKTFSRFFIYFLSLSMISNSIIACFCSFFSWVAFSMTICCDIIILYIAFIFVDCFQCIERRKCHRIEDKIQFSRLSFCFKFKLTQMFSNYSEGEKNFIHFSDIQIIFSIQLKWPMLDVNCSITEHVRI